MPVPLPNLDDRTYDDLTAEARALLPSLDPSWTDHNPSDPGIALVELFAWLTEMLLFQVNEVPPASTVAFLSLLNGPGWSLAEGESVPEATARTMQRVRERYRAVTVDDYEHLALHDWSTTEAARALGADGQVARVRCVPRRNLAGSTESLRTQPAAGHVSLVVVPAPTGGRAHPQPGPKLLAELSDFFAPRRTLATRLHVVGPGYAAVAIGASLGLVDDAPPDQAFADAQAALLTFFDPFTGGPEGTGWPFGRDVHASEVYAVLERVALLDHVDDVRVTGLRPLLDEAGTAVGAQLDAHELVALSLTDLVAYDVNGKRHDPPPSVPPLVLTPGSAAPGPRVSPWPATMPAALVVALLGQNAGFTLSPLVLGALQDLPPGTSGTSGLENV